jgi:fatty acid desaturase
MKSKVFAHSRLDGLLVLVALAQFGLLTYGVLSFGIVDWKMSLILGLINVFLICTNFQCVAHNFIHNPFFARKGWNTAFGMFNSLLVGGPQSLYRLHHMNHHRYNNDYPDPEIGTTRDASSTWRHGLPPVREESLLSYAVLGYFRTDFGWLMREVKRKGLGRNCRLESASLGVMLAALAALNPLGLVAFYLPVWALGNMAAQAENYLEHHGTTPGDRKTDSVSSYGAFYNLIWFNNGYHQEHHYRPQVHWTLVPTLRSLLPPESERRVVRGAHWFNFGVTRTPARDEAKAAIRVALPGLSGVGLAMEPPSC